MMIHVLLEYAYVHVSFSVNSIKFQMLIWQLGYFMQLEGVTTDTLKGLQKLLKLGSVYTHGNTCLCLTVMNGASHMPLFSISMSPLFLV